MADFPVFISWSRDASKHMAESLRTFLELVVGRTKPWVSSIDIDAGSRWPVELRNEIEATCFCVVCVTSDNIDRPWLNYEIGAISEGLRKPTAPWMLDITPENFALFPLNPNQGCKTDLAGTRKLILDINKAMGADGQKEAIVLKQFETHWSDLATNIEEARTLLTKPAPTSRQPPEVLDELVRNTRAILDRLPGHSVSEMAAALGMRPMARWGMASEEAKGQVDPLVADWTREFLAQVPMDGAPLTELVEFCERKAHQDKVEGFETSNVVPSIRAYKEFRIDPDTMKVRYRRK